MRGWDCLLRLFSFSRHLIDTCFCRQGKLAFNMLACSSSDKLHSGQRLEVYLNWDSLQWDNEVESGLLLSRKECLEVSTLFDIMITHFLYPACRSKSKVELSFIFSYVLISCFVNMAPPFVQWGLHNPACQSIGHRTRPNLTVPEDGWSAWKERPTASLGDVREGQLCN